MFIRNDKMFIRGGDTEIFKNYKPLPFAKIFLIEDTKSDRKEVFVALQHIGGQQLTLV